MNEGELHLQRMRDQLCAKKPEELTGDEKVMLGVLDEWHLHNFRAMLAYGHVLDVWAKQQLRGMKV
jgi:hypothetical protein